MKQVREGILAQNQASFDASEGRASARCVSWRVTGSILAKLRTRRSSQGALIFVLRDPSHAWQYLQPSSGAAQTPSTSAAQGRRSKQEKVADSNHASEDSRKEVTPFALICAADRDASIHKNDRTTTTNPLCRNTACCCKIS